MKQIQFNAVGGAEYILIPVPTLEEAIAVLEIVKKDKSFTNGNYARYNMQKNWKMYKEDSIFIYSADGVITMTAASSYVTHHTWKPAVMSSQKFINQYGEMVDPIPEMLKSLDLLAETFNA